MPRLATLLALALVCAPVSQANTESFETVPERSPAELLPGAMVSGPDFHVVDPVQGDGLMNRFLVDSRFGGFDAYGREALAMRVHEVQALSELAKSSDVEIAAGGVVQGVAAEVKTATAVVTHPVQTVTGIPKGIAHLFGGYKAQGQEAAADARRSLASSGDGSAGGAGHGVEHAAAKSEHAARSYAERYLGITGAEREYYRKLGVDPYTDNKVLRDTIRRDAKIRAAAGFGMKFVGVAGIPGIGLTQRAVDTINNEDPAEIRQRTRKTLTGYGLTASEIDSFMNGPLLTPTRQVLLLAAADALAGVAGRTELFRHSIGLTSVEEVEVYLASVGLLVKAHARHPLREIVAGVRLPAAELADHRLIVCGAFESVYWTQGVAQAEEQLRALLPVPPAGAARELWIAGSISAAARSALESRGWELLPVTQNLPP